MSTPLHVLYVLEATQGGTRRHLRDLVCLLDRSQFVATVAVSCLRDPLFTNEDKPFYEAAEAGWVELPMKRAVRPVSDLLACRALESLVCRLRPDVVHAHSSKAGALARIACRGRGVPVVYTPHAFPFLMRGCAAGFLYHAFERMAIPWTDAVICVSEEELRAARGLGYPENKIFFVRNGISKEDVPPAGRDEREAVVGFFGRDVRQKGADVLRACHRVPVRFFTNYRQWDAVRLMRGVSVAAMPSRWEGCPYALLEAWAAETPVVASASGGLAEMIEDGVNGVLLPPSAPPSVWERTLLALLRDPGRRSVLAEGGRKSLVRYSRERMVAETCAVYAAVKR